MKNIAYLSLAVFSASFAADISHSLEFYGDTISKSLLRYGHIKTKNDTKSIERVLKLNGLDWESAKRLPVGQLYYVTRERVELAKAQPTYNAPNSVTKKITKSEHKFSFEFGSFYHTQSLNSANIFSDLSQYANIDYDYKKSLYVDGKIKRYAYSADQEQNLEADSENYTYDISLGKIYSTQDSIFKLGAYTKEVLNFDLDSLNTVSIDTANTNGLNAAAKTNFYRGDTLTWFAGLDIKKNLASSQLDDYLGAVSQIGTSFKYDDNTLSIILRYGYSELEEGSKSISDQLASLGLKAFF